MTKRGRPIEILLVEDSPSDALITREALAESRVLNSLHQVDNGVEAMRYLRREGDYANAPRPDLVLLDWKLPRMSGEEVLAAIRQDPALTDLPIVVLSTSKAEEDVLTSYGLHANCFITKPVEFGRFVEVIRSVGDFWFSIVTLPGAAR
ncbi:MAG: response regulator [bacterium]